MQAGLLTIGIVTIPFLFEGKRKILQALDGVKQMRQSVDALLVVNNQRLIEIYADYTMDNAFEKADDTLSNAARGISDMVNAAGKINLDFADVETTLRGGGVAVINTGYGEGPGRVMTAINDALNSPLLNNNSINQARHLLINVYQSTEEPLTTKELSELSEFTETFTNDVETIFGYAYREDLGPKVAVTILASGFDFEEEDFRPGISKPQDPLERIHREGRRNAEDDLIRRTYGDSALIRPKVEPIALLIDELDDEELLLPYFNRASQDFKLIIAPHEIHEEHLRSIETKLQRPSVRYTALQRGERVEHYDCLIIDCFGLLSSIYRYGRYAYIGGGFGKSVHNTLEAAVYGIPVFFGPEIHKHREVRELCQHSAGFILHTEGELSTLISRFDDPMEAQRLSERSQAYFATQRGATKTILSALFPKE